MENLYEIKLIFYAGSTLLESPCWSKEKKALLFVSIEQKIVYYYDIEQNVIITFKMKGQVGCAVFETENTILVAEYTGIYRINIETGERRFVVHLNDNPQLRYNDGIIDPVGRFLVGTTGYNCLAEKQNSLYSWNGMEKKILVHNTTISNGIDFSKDGRFMYFVDTPTKVIKRFLYNIYSGEAEYDEDIIYIKDESFPDGICTDIDDMLWVAQWGGGKVSKWNPYTGEKLFELQLPCKNVSSCCVGGEEDKFLFVTTAQHDDGTISEMMAGGLFSIQIRE